MEFKVYFDTEFLNRLSWRFFSWRIWLIAAIVAFLIAIFLLAPPWGEVLNLTILIVGCTVVGITASVLLLTYIRIWRVNRAFLNRQKGEPVLYRFSDEFFEASSAAGNLQLRWPAFSRVRIDNLALTLHLPGRPVGGIPIRQIPGDAIELVKAKLLAAKKKVRDRRKSK